MYHLYAKNSKDLTPMHLFNKKNMFYEYERTYDPELICRFFIDEFIQENTTIKTPTFTTPFPTTPSPTTPSPTTPSPTTKIKTSNKQTRNKQISKIKTVGINILQNYNSFYKMSVLFSNCYITDENKTIVYNPTDIWNKKTTLANFKIESLDFDLF